MDGFTGAGLADDLDQLISRLDPDAIDRFDLIPGQDTRASSGGAWDQIEYRQALARLDPVQVPTDQPVPAGTGIVVAIRAPKYPFPGLLVYEKLQ